MEKDKKSFWKWILIVLEAIGGLFVLWILCTIFSLLLSLALMKLCLGKCTFEYFEEYYNFIRVGYIAVYGVCISQYLQWLNKKHKIL